MDRGLEFEDIENVQRVFPTLSSTGDVQWAVAGGGAVWLLMEAEEVRGRVFKDKTFFQDRGHKDLDLVAFRKPPHQLRVEYPAEVFYTNDDGPRIYRTNYLAPVNHFAGRFYTELLTDYYYGFPPPTARDVEFVAGPNGEVAVLSPEYLVASRLFKTSGWRKYIDADDARLLLKRFPLDSGRVWDAVSRSPYGFLGKDRVRVYLESGAIEKIQVDGAHESVRRHRKILDLVQGSASHLPLTLCLLQFDANEIDPGRLLSAFDHAPASNLELKWAVALLLVHLDPADLVRSEPLHAAVRSLDVSQSDEYLRLFGEFSRGLNALKRQFEKMQLADLWRRVAFQLVLRFVMCRDYRTIMNAILAHLPRRMEAHANDLDGAMRELKRLLDFGAGGTKREARHA